MHLVVFCCPKSLNGPQWPHDKGQALGWSNSFLCLESHLLLCSPPQTLKVQFTYTNMQIWLSLFCSLRNLSEMSSPLWSHHYYASQAPLLSVQFHLCWYHSGLNLFRYFHTTLSLVRMGTVCSSQSRIWKKNGAQLMSELEWEGRWWVSGCGEISGSWQCPSLLWSPTCHLLAFKLVSGSVLGDNGPCVMWPKG